MAKAHVVLTNVLGSGGSNSGTVDFVGYWAVIYDDDGDIVTGATPTTSASSAGPGAYEAGPTDTILSIRSGIITQLITLAAGYSVTLTALDVVFLN